MSEKMLSNSGVIFSKLIPVMKGVVSFAYLGKISIFIYNKKIVNIYIINRRGPRIDPCRTP